jgi:hypothetical protein
MTFFSTAAKARIAVIAFSILTATPALAADVTGTWNATVDLGSRKGTPTFVLKQSGDALTGTYTGQLGTSDVTGTAKDNAVDFTFSVMGATVKYDGKLDAAGNSMSGTVDYGGQASGTFTATRK